MDRKFKTACGSMLALFCGLCLCGKAHGENLPDGKGKAEFIHNCTACHRADMVTRVKKTPDEWRKSVDEMASRGTDGTKEDLDNVVLYLDTYYAAGTPNAAATTQSQPPPSSPSTPAALNSSEIAGVKQLITAKGCLACHRIEQQGSYLGPSLNGLGARRSADEIRSAILNPHPTLDPNNDLAQFSTADGQPHMGRILTQDHDSVRVIEASGKATTYSRQSLHQFTLVTANPMPHYEGQISGDDLDRLVLYLESLPPEDKRVNP